MNLTSPDLREKLAAEYVLGTLKGLARRRFETHLANDAALRERVAAWEARITPLALSLPPVTPPVRVWQKISARIAATRAAPAETRASNGFWGNIGFWRSLGLGASGLAAALLITVFSGGLIKTQLPDPMMTAVLEENGEARMVVDQPQSGYIMVKMIKPWQPMPGMALQLWVIPKEGAPKSLGLVNEHGDTKLTLADIDRLLAGGAIVAVSKEPAGGSPTGQPTGMVMCKGVIAHMPEKVKKPRGAI